MAVGSTIKSPKRRHNKAELFLHSSSTWQTRASYPFHNNIRAFEILAYSNYFIFFGGLYLNENLVYDATDIIAKFNPDSNQWTKMGNLQYSRHAFGVIEIDKKFLVMGGWDEKRSEICELKNDSIDCNSREPTLIYFFYYPAIMIVPSDYNDNC